MRGPPAASLLQRSRSVCQTWAAAACPPGRTAQPAAAILHFTQDPAGRVAAGAPPACCCTSATSTSTSVTAWRSALHQSTGDARAPTRLHTSRIRACTSSPRRAAHTSAAAAAAGSSSQPTDAWDGEGDDDNGEGSAPAVPPAACIASPANPYIKHCVKLRSSSRYRGEMSRVLLVGSELLKEAVGVTGTLPARVVLVRQDLVPADKAAAGSSSSRGPAAAGSRLGPPAVRQRPSTASGRPAGAEQPAGGPTEPPRPRASAAVVSALVPGLVPDSTVLVSEPALKKVTGLLNVDSIDLVAELDLPPPLDLNDPGVKIRRLLALDRIQDPGNLGTLIRTAMALGWDGVFLLQGCADPFGDKAIRASRGAALRFPICRGDLLDLQAAARTRNLRLLAAEPDESLGPGPQSLGQGQGAGGTQQQGGPQEVLPEPGVCLVLGSEGQGLSPEALACCTPVAIPMAGGCMESLNVGIAGGILMFMLSSGMPQLSRRLEELRGSG